MIDGAGQKNVLRWQASALAGGSVLAFLSTSLVLFSSSPGRLRTTGWWLAGLAGGLLTAAFAFPVAALNDAPVSAVEPKTYAV